MFGDATVVLTHRDPADVVVSMATMVAYSARMHQSPVDPVRIGHAWADRIELMLRACVRDRDLLSADCSIDVRFDDLMADEDAVIAAIYNLADEPLTVEASDAMRHVSCRAPTRAPRPNRLPRRRRRT